MSRRSGALVATIWILASCGNAGDDLAPLAPPPSVRVIADSSLQPALDEISKELLAIHDVTPIFKYTDTETLATQLVQGAPADVFASVDTAYTSAMSDAGLLIGDPKVFAHDELEIVVKKGNPKGIRALADLANRRILVVLADPSVSAGKYALQVLDKARVEIHSARLQSQVADVLTEVAFGDADAGIVFTSEITTTSEVDGVTIPENVQAQYNVAAFKSAKYPAAALSFVNFLTGPDSQSILKAHGFQGI